MLLFHIVRLIVELTCDAIGDAIGDADDKKYEDASHDIESPPSWFPGNAATGNGVAAMEIDAN
jgi:hypothetical protein